MGDNYPPTICKQNYSSKQLSNKKAIENCVTGSFDVVELIINNFILVFTISPFKNYFLFSL